MGEILERGHVRCEVERIEGRGRSPTVRRVMNPDVAICFEVLWVVRVMIRRVLYRHR